MLGFFLEAETLILPDSVQKAQWKQIVERFTSLDAETFLRDFTGQVIWVALKIAVAFAIYAAGRWIINRLVRLMDASFDRRQVDKSLRSFLRSLVKGAAYTILLLIIVQLLGFNTTSLVALLAASGFGIGMALSGTLQNFAGGIMVMFMHPYRIGDYIEAQGQAGTVKEIRLFSTVVTTTDNKRIYIPNSSISNAIVNNYSSETMRRSIERLRRLDFVVIDTPPMGMFPDAELLCDMADQSMLVVRQDTIPAADINDCVDALNNSSAHFLGCVLNDMRGSSGYGYGYGRGYGYGKKYGYYGNYKKEAGSADGRMNG